MSTHDSARIETSDTQLVRAFCEGDRDAFALLYERHHAHLVIFLRAKTADAALAEDLAQDAWLRLGRALGGFDPDKPVWPYLKMIGQNLLIDHRRLHPVCALSLDLDADLALRSSVPDHADEVVLRPVVDSAISELPSRQRAAIHLQYVRGWSAKQSANFMGLNATAFRQLSRRARANLHEYIESTGMRSLPVLLLAPLQTRWRRLSARLRMRGLQWIEAAQVGSEGVVMLVMVATVAVGAVMAGFGGTTSDRTVGQVDGDFTKSPVTATHRIDDVVTDADGDPGAATSRRGHSGADLAAPELPASADASTTATFVRDERQWRYRVHVEATASTPVGVIGATWDDTMSVPCWDAYATACDVLEAVTADPGL